MGWFLAFEVLPQCIGPPQARRWTDVLRTMWGGVKGELLPLASDQVVLGSGSFCLR